MHSCLPLQNLKVLELSHIVAGPAASLILADLGADVIEIKRTDGGDQARQMPGTGQLMPTEFPGGRVSGVPKMPFKSSAFEMSKRRLAPGLGEHTREVLAEAGYSADEIEAMVTESVVMSGEAANLP